MDAVARRELDGLPASGVCKHLYFAPCRPGKLKRASGSRRHDADLYTVDVEPTSGPGPCRKSHEADDVACGAASTLRRDPTTAARLFAGLPTPVAELAAEAGAHQRRARQGRAVRLGNFSKGRRFASVCRSLRPSAPRCSSATCERLKRVEHEAPRRRPRQHRPTPARLPNIDREMSWKRLWHSAVPTLDAPTSSRVA